MKNFPQQLTLHYWNRLAGAFHKTKAVHHFLEEREPLDDSEKNELAHWLDVIEDIKLELWYVEHLVREKIK